MKAPALISLGVALLGVCLWLVAVTPSDGTGPGLLRLAHAALIERDPLFLDAFLLWGFTQLAGALLVVLAGFPILWAAPKIARGIRSVVKR